MTTSPRPIQSVTNAELYNRWAKVYDTDGNILQAVDDHVIPSLLSHAFTLLSSQSPIIVTELGAGTGRNTAKLLLPSGNPSVEIQEINALDLSPGMLEVAKKRCQDIITTLTTAPPRIQFLEFDAFSPSAFPDVQNLERKADLVVSTLVLEHLPMGTFFQTARKLMKDGGILLLTNMHSEMGNISQAGFVDEDTGEKVRGTSFAHEIPEVVEEGRKWGFVVEGSVGEREVRKEDIGEGKLLGPRGRKWIGVRVWYGFVMRLEAGKVEMGIE